MILDVQYTWARTTASLLMEDKDESPDQVFQSSATLTATKSTRGKAPTALFRKSTRRFTLVYEYWNILKLIITLSLLCLALGSAFLNLHRHILSLYIHKLNQISILSGSIYV